MPTGYICQNQQFRYLIYPEECMALLIVFTLFINASGFILEQPHRAGRTGNALP